MIKAVCSERIMTRAYIYVYIFFFSYVPLSADDLICEKKSIRVSARISAKFEDIGVRDVYDLC